MKYPYIKSTVDGITLHTHRHVMQKMIGRKLRHNEVVHHKNGDCRDNRQSKLELMTRSEHTSHHMIGNKHTLGHKLNNTQKEALLKALIGNKHTLGRKLSIEHKNAIVLANKGRKAWNKNLNKENNTLMMEHSNRMIGNDYARKKISPQPFS